MKLMQRTWIVNKEHARLEDVSVCSPAPASLRVYVPHGTGTYIEGDAPQQLELQSECQCGGDAAGVCGSVACEARIQFALAPSVLAETIPTPCTFRARSSHAGVSREKTLADAQQEHAQRVQELNNPHQEHAHGR